MGKSQKGNMKRRRSGTAKKSMKGGFAPDEMQHLINNGFQENEINELDEKNITLATVNQAIDYFNNNSHQIIIGIAENLHANATQLNNLSLHESSLNTSQSSQPLLNLDDLQVPEGHEIPHNLNDIHDMDMNQSLDLSGDTSIADESMNNSLNHSITGGKKTKKNKKMLRHKKTNRIQKGGVLYGRGYGANCNDPNFSVYNTNLTKLFPYKPTR